MESYKIKGKEYLVEEVSRIEIQDSNPGAYGWTLEYKSRYSDSWHMCWGNRIYNSRQSALNAALQIGMNSKEEFRISPLYKMDNVYMREFKICQVLDGKTPEEKKISEIKAWKLKVDIDESTLMARGIGKHKKESIFIKLENGSIIKSGNVSDKTRFIWSSSFKKVLSSELFDEIELKEEKWLYPHLLKELKNKINKK
jgi:hypothetical protein